MLGPRVLSQSGSSAGTVSGSVVTGVVGQAPARAAVRGLPTLGPFIAPRTAACPPPEAMTVLHYSRSSLRNLLVTFTV